MTNRELLLTPGADIHEQTDRQDKFLLQISSKGMPCPACTCPVNLFAGAGIELDDYDFGQTHHSYHCPDCQAELEHVVPAISGNGNLWHWKLKGSP